MTSRLLDIANLVTILGEKIYWDIDIDLTAASNHKNGLLLPNGLCQGNIMIAGNGLQPLGQRFRIAFRQLLELCVRRGRICSRTSLVETPESLT